LPISQQAFSVSHPENKKPRLSEVFIRVLRLVAAEHTVLRQRKKVYAIEEERAIPARILTFLSMDRLPNFVHKILFMHTVFIYTEGVRSERGGRSSTGATKSWLKRVVPSVP
jgi:hypothetical protein